MTGALEERYDTRIAGVLSCYDRVVITGTLPTVCYADGMTRFLHANGIRIFEYPDFASKLRDQVRTAAARVADASDVTIEHIAKSHIRKESVVAKVLERRGDRPGLVHVISAMEACDAYKPWHDMQTHRNEVRPTSGKCLHYYFYFMDAELGLVYLRVPTPGSSPGAGSGRRSACNSTATATAAWPANWRRRISASPWPTTLSPVSLTGNVHRTWLMGSRLTCCTVCWTAMPRCAARYWTSSARPTTGA